MRRSRWKAEQIGLAEISRLSDGFAYRVEASAHLLGNLRDRGSYGL
ncbi:hypothetical protein [Gluconobacter cadivus]|nr:hypothetical protein [Gluconobacter cadivus]